MSEKEWVLVHVASESEMVMFQRDFAIKHTGYLKKIPRLMFSAFAYYRQICYII
jgi:hypothetical protein